MQLIADSGSTNTSWCLLKGSSSSLNFQTEGYNPFYTNSQYIISSVAGQIPAGVIKGEVSAIYFYGAGCGEGKDAIVKEALSSIFPNASISIAGDMLAAARALLQNGPGFAAILGTGTNTCVYNGKEISHSINSLGFMLGDEGSGADMGKRLLVDYLRGAMPADISQLFKEQYQPDSAVIMDKIYCQPLPNRYCATFSKFLFETRHNPYSANLIKQSFGALFTNLVSLYPEYKEYDFNCSGSIAYYFKDKLAEAANSFSMRVGNIISAPINNLIKYHVSLNTTL